jgi:hypothetical protein
MSIRFQRTIVATTYSSPSGRGLAAMMMLNVLSGYDVGGMTDADRIHVFAEASKQTNLYRNKLFGDPSVEDVPVDYLLPADWHERARTRIGLSRAQPAVFRSPKPHKDTIYLCVVDVDGSLSLINSLFEPFGSGILAPDKWRDPQQSRVLIQPRGGSSKLHRPAQAADELHCPGHADARGANGGAIRRHGAASPALFCRGGQLRQHARPSSLELPLLIADDAGGLRRRRRRVLGVKGDADECVHNHCLLGQFPRGVLGSEPWNRAGIVRAGPIRIGRAAQPGIGFGNSPHFVRPWHPVGFIPAERLAVGRAPLAPDGQERPRRRCHRAVRSAL